MCVKSIGDNMSISAVSNNFSKNYNVNFKANEAPRTNVPKEGQDSFVSSSEHKKNTNKNLLIGLGVALTAIAVTAFAFRGKIKNMFTHFGTDFKRLLAEDVKKIKQIPKKKADTAGETVQETIENVFGKNSKITPHTYDISKEYPTISVYRDCGGYKDGIVSKDGILEDYGFSHLLPKPTRHSTSYHVVNPKTKAPIDLSARKGVSIYEGTVEGIENKVVQLDISDTGCLAHDRIMRISIISPDNKLTPVQKDILKLAETPEKIDISVIDKLLEFKNASNADGSIITENVGKYKNLDYDLILSAFQSMLK